MDDAQFLSMLNIVLQKHGCYISEANYENRILFIEGEEAAQAACAEEIETLLGDYTI